MKELQSILDSAEKEFTDLDAKLAPLKAEWNKLREERRPIDDKMSAIEVQIDALKPRHGELTRGINELRKILPSSKVKE